MIKAYYIIALSAIAILFVQQLASKQFKLLWLVPLAGALWPITITIGILNKPKGEKKIANVFNGEHLRIGQIYVKEKRTWDLGTDVVFQARGKGYISKWMHEPELKEYLQMLYPGCGMSTDLHMDDVLDGLERMMR